MTPTRREFLVTSASLAGVALSGELAMSQVQREQAEAGPPSPAAQFPDRPPAADAVPDFVTPATTSRGDMQYRTLGRTGQTVSLLGLGGFHLSIPKADDEALRIVRKAIDHGVTFMDNSWDYANGKSETRMGQALRDGYRQKVFLMTKLDGRTAKAADQQLEESLKRLQVDVIDLVQIHEVLRLEDPDRSFEPGGVVEALVAARKAGKIRYIGFTGHKDPVVHLRMLETAKLHDFHFDTAQMPLNVMDAHFRSFAHQVLPELVKEQMGILGMKPLGSGEVVTSKTVEPIEALHYAMNLPTSVVITGCDSEKILDQALEAAKTFKPLPREQIAALLAKTKQAAQFGQYERFKTSNVFDSTAKNPQWLG
jgi:aryl-alcohol dehydrogenase-like predicted oxidoreductase